MDFFHLMHMLTRTQHIRLGEDICDLLTVHTSVVIAYILYESSWTRYVSDLRYILV